MGRVEVATLGGRSNIDHDNTCDILGKVAVMETNDEPSDKSIEVPKLEEATI